MQVSSLGWEDPLKKEMAILQYSCLENSTDRRAWWATVHGVATNLTWLSTACTHTHTRVCVCIHLKKKKITLATLRKKFEGSMSKDKKIQVEGYSPSKILYCTCLETQQWREEINRFERCFEDKSTSLETIKLGRRKMKDYTQVSCSRQQLPSWALIFPTSW